MHGTVYVKCKKMENSLIVKMIIILARLASSARSNVSKEIRSTVVVLDACAKTHGVTGTLLNLFL